MATGLAPYCQTRQFFLPAFAPVTLSGWNGVGLPPTGSPDLMEDSPARAPDKASAATAKAPTAKRFFIVVYLSPKNRRHADHLCWSTTFRPHRVGFHSVFLPFSPSPQALHA